MASKGSGGSAVSEILTIDGRQFQVVGAVTEKDRSTVTLHVLDSTSWLV